MTSDAGHYVRTTQTEPRILPVTERLLGDRVNGTLTRPMAGLAGRLSVILVERVRTV